MIRTSAVLLVLLAPVAAATGQELQPRYSEAGRLARNHSWSAADSPDGRFVVYYAWDDTTRVLDRRTGRNHALATQLGATDFSWSPRGDLIAFGRKDEDGERRLTPWVIPVDPRTGRATGPARKLSTRIMPRFDEAPAFSPDGRQLAFSAVDGDSFRILRVPVVGGPETVVARGRGYGMLPQWSKDGGSIFYARRDPMASEPGFTIVKVPVGGGAEDTLGRGTYFVGLSGDGKYLSYYAEGHPRSQSTPITMVVATVDGVERARFEPEVRLKTWSSTGATLLGVRPSMTGPLRVLDVETGRLREITSGVDGERAPGWSPDGKRIAYQVQGNGGYGWAVIGRDGGEPRRFPVSRTRNDPPLWSPDGRMIAYVSRPADSLRWSQIRVLDLTTGEDRVIAELAGSIPQVSLWDRTRSMAWLPDARTVRFQEVLADGTRRLGEADLGGRVRVLPDALPSTRARRTLAFVDHRTLLSAGPGGVTLLRVGADSVPILSDTPHIDGALSWRIGVSDDGRRIVVEEPMGERNPRHRLSVIDTADRSSRTVEFDLPYDIQNYTFDRDGQRIYFWGSAHSGNGLGSRYADLFVVDAAGGPARMLTGADEDATDIDGATLSPDSRSIVYYAEVPSDHPARLYHVRLEPTSTSRK